MNAKNQVLRILARFKSENKGNVFPPQSASAIERAESRLGFRIPRQLQEFLSACNGIEAGRDALFGVVPPKDCFDLVSIYLDIPRFKELGILPVGGDGCGNYYVLDIDSGGVYFFESLDEDVIYIVASDFWHFAYFYLTEDSAKVLWPGEKKYVLKADPNILKRAKVPPLWDV